MHYLPSSYYHPPSMNQIGNMYNQIGCQFLICESCFLTATIFKRLDKSNNYHRTNIRTCPICYSKNISIISLSTNEDNHNNTKCTYS
jgi:hypothetical protein